MYLFWTGYFRGRVYWAKPDKSFLRQSPSSFIVFFVRFQISFRLVQSRRKREIGSTFFLRQSQRKTYFTLNSLYSYREITSSPKRSRRYSAPFWPDNCTLARHLSCRSTAAKYRHLPGVWVGCHGGGGLWQNASSADWSIAGVNSSDVLKYMCEPVPPCLQSFPAVGTTAAVARRFSTVDPSVKFNNTASSLSRIYNNTLA